MRLPTEEEARIMGLKNSAESSDPFTIENPETIYPKHKELEVAFNIANSSGITPQRAAESVRIAKDSGVTSDLIHSSKVLREKALLDERKNAIRPVLSHIARKRPTTRKFLREPENMLLAQNDLGSLDKAEGLLEIPMRSLKANHLETKIHDLYGEAVLNGMNDGLQRQIDALTEERAALGEVPQGIVKNYLWQSMVMIPQLWELYKSGGGLGAAMAAGGALGALALGQAGPQLMLPEEIITAPAAAAIMGYKGWQIGSMRKAFKIEAGSAYSEFREIPNVDDTTARVAAGVVGAVNGAIELATMSTLIKTFPGGKETLKKLAGKEVIRAALKNPTTRGALFEFTKTYAKGMSVETIQEVVQEFVNIIGGDILKDRVGVDVLTWKETGGRLGETAVQTVMATSLINLPGPAAGLHKNLRRANAASLTARTLSDVAQVMDATEVKALAPSVAERYVRENLENSGNEISYLPASKVVELYQDSGLEEFRETFPDVLGVTEEESVEAMKKGLDIEIESAKLLTADKSVRDAILPFASFEPEGMSLAEAERFATWADKSMEKDVETANYLIEQETRYLASAQRYADSLRMRLEAMGEKEKEAAAYAEMAARMQITIARRLNEVTGKGFAKKTGEIMPEDAAKMFPIYFKKGDGDNLTGMYMQSSDAVEGIYRAYDANVVKKISDPNRQLRVHDEHLIGQQPDIYEISIGEMLDNAKDNDGVAYLQRGKGKHGGIETYYQNSAKVWEQRLAKENKRWNEMLVQFAPGPQSRDFLKIMDVPLVLQMLGHMEEGKLIISSSKFNRLLKEHKSELDINDLQNLPELIANPVMVLSSSLHSTHPDSVIVVINVQSSKNGASVFLPISLTKKSSRDLGTYYQVSSMYTQSKNGANGERIANPQRYRQWIEDEELLVYADLAQLPEWEKKNVRFSQYIKKISPSDFSRVQFPRRGRTRANGYIIQTEGDLVNKRAKYNNELYQQSNGSIVFPRNPGQPTRITLGKTANRSTTMHEMAHWYLYMLRNLRDMDSGTNRNDWNYRPPGWVSDLNTVASWWNESAEDITGWILKKKEFSYDVKKQATPEAFRSWLNSGMEAKSELGAAFDTAAHEYFARGFEAYLREGKAPIASLQEVFRQFKKWLTEVYRTIRQLDVELGDEVRAVYDRMLATDDAIEQFRAEREIEYAFASELTEEEALNLSPFSEDEIYEAAKERVLSGLMEELSPEMRDKVAVRADELRPQIAGAVAEERPYRILAMLNAEPEMRIDEGAFIDAISETAADSLPAGLLAADGGMDFGLALKNLGYGSVDEFLSDFSGRRTFEAEVDFRLGERLKLEFASAMESSSRMEEAVRRAWYEGDEHAKRLAAEAAVDFADIYVADEAAKGTADDPANRVNVVRFVRTHGYVNYSSVATEFGIERARELRKRDPFIFRKSGYGLDELAQEMRGNGIPVSSDEHLFNIILGPDVPVSPLVTARDEGYAEGRASVVYGYGKSEEQAQTRRRSLDRMLKNLIGKEEAKQKLSSANTAAENIVGDMTIEGLRNVVPFVKAEKNALMKAENALRRNDEESFRKWKERELVNNAVVRRMYKSQQEAEIIRSWLDRYDKRKKNQTFGMDVRFVKQVDALLTRFNLEKMKNMTAEKRKEALPAESLLKFMEEMAAEETPILVPDWILESSAQRNYSQLMLWQLRDVQKTVKNIVHAGRQEKHTISLNKSAEFKAIEDEIIDEAKAFYGKKATGKGTELRVENKTADRKIPLPFDTADDLYTPEAICRAVGGYKDNSAMERYVFRPVREGQTRVCLALNDYFGRLQKLKAECYGDKKFSPDKFEIDVPVYERIEDPGAPGRFVYVATKEKQHFTRENVVCFLFNLGNAGNIARLKNHGFTERDINYIKDLGTEEDWKFVQGVWNVLEEMRPQLAKVHELMTGTPFVPVKAQPVVTKFGTFRGGYYHIATDARYSQSAAAQSERREVMTSAGAHHLNVYTESGHRKERAEDVDGRPINFLLSVLDHHVANVVYDYEMTPVIRDVRKLLRRERLQRLIEDTLNRRQALNLNKWLNDIAANTKNNGLTLDTKDQILNIALRQTAVFSLGANTAGALLQTLGYFPLAHRIGFTNAALAVWRGLRHPHETWSLALEKSEFMREQMRNTGVELRNLRKSWTTDGKKMNGATDKMLSIYPLFQNMCNVPGWCQSYTLGLKKLGGNETEAIAYADAVIRQTQSASTIADLSTFERGGPFAKFFSMFYSWFRVQYQMQTEAVRKAYYGKGFKGKMGDLASYAFYVLLCQSVMEGLIRGNTPDSDDEDPFLVRWAKWTMNRAFTASISPIPGLRDILSFVENDFGYRISPAASYFESFYKLGMSGDKFLSDPDGEWTDLIESAATAAGYATGIPNRKMIQAAKVFWSWYDEGKSIPWAYLLLGGGHRPKD